MASHPGVEYSGLRRTKNVEWEMCWNTEMGCMRASAKSLGVTVTDAELFGGTGVGFLINVDERAEAKSMAVWNWRGAYELCPNLGFSVESIWSHKSNKEFSTTQKLFGTEFGRRSTVGMPATDSIWTTRSERSSSGTTTSILPQGLGSGEGKGAGVLV